MSKILHLTFSVIVIFFCNISLLKADLLIPNDSILPEEVIKIQLVALMNNDKEIDAKKIQSEYQSKHIKIWHLLNAVGQKNLSDSISIYSNLHINGVSSVPIIMQLYNLFIEMIS